MKKRIRKKKGAERYMSEGDGEDDGSGVASLTPADYVTLSNGLVGFLAITYIVDGKLRLASILLMLCIFLDGLDGYVARKMDFSHLMGSFLDLISDTVSFCFAPALLVYSAFYDIALGRAWEHPMSALATIVPMIIVFFGVLRLSRFAHENHSNDCYSGLPTPAMTIFIVSSIFLMGMENSFIYQPYLVLVAIIAVSLLFYTKIRYPKIRGVGLKASTMAVIMITVFGIFFSKNNYLVSSLLLSITLTTSILYILISPVFAHKIYKKNK